MTDLGSKIATMLAQKQDLIARGLAKAMKAYQDNPTAQNLRDIKAAEAALAEIEAAAQNAGSAVPDDGTTALDQEESRLTRSRDAALALAKRKPTQANLKTMKKAEAALAKLRKERSEASGAETFANILDVVAHLDADGWKISKSAAYEHRDEGKIQPRPGDGRFTLAAVQDYARLYLQRKDGGRSETAPKLQEQKLVEEIRRISRDAEMRELKLMERRGELISREHVEVELASRANDLKTHMDASDRASVGRMIKIVGGDPQKAPELISFLLAANKKILDNYSRPIQGPDEEEE